MNPAFALAEIVWILNGRNDSAFLNFFNSRLPEYAGRGPTYHGAYGHRLRTPGSLDQLRRASAALRARPDTRQVVLQIWNSRLDLPRRDGAPVAKDIPCNICSMLKVREGVLEWMQIIRSNDVFLGLPHNIVQFTTLQEVIAGWIGVKPGAYHQLSDSLHAYVQDLRSLQGGPKVTHRCRNEDALALPERESLRVFRELARRVDKLTTGLLKERSLRRLAEWPTVPLGYQNMVRVLVAEAARRRPLQTVADDIMTDCSNPVYVALWNNWLARLRRGKPASGRCGDGEG